MKGAMNSIKQIKWIESEFAPCMSRFLKYWLIILQRLTPKLKQFNSRLLLDDEDEHGARKQKLYVRMSKAYMHSLQLQKAYEVLGKVIPSEHRDSMKQILDLLQDTWSNRMS
jgi:hypothetical protein